MRFTFFRRRMSQSYVDVPLGIRVIQKISSKCFAPTLQVNRVISYKFSVLFLTYITYICYHLTRKPISVVKSVLHRNCSEVELPKDFKLLPNDSTWCDYPPFDGDDSAALLGYLDSSFLFSYGSAMFVSGLVAERVSLRYFLTFGMLLSAIFTYLFGIGKTYDIHSIWYFVFVQAMAGICQTTGWPGVVTVVGRWFGKEKRGFIFGVWNSHMSIGNIMGSLIAAHYVETDWALSFIVPGLIMGAVGMLLFLFLVDSPDIVGCQDKIDRRNSVRNVEVGVNSDGSSDVDDTDIVIGDHESNPSMRSLRGSINSTKRRDRTKVDGHLVNHTNHSLKTVQKLDDDQSDQHVVNNDQTICQIDTINQHRCNINDNHLGEVIIINDTAKGVDDRNHNSFQSRDKPITETDSFVNVKESNGNCVHVDPIDQSNHIGRPDDIVTATENHVDRVKNHVDRIINHEKPNHIEITPNTDQDNHISRLNDDRDNNTEHNSKHSDQDQMGNTIHGNHIDQIDHGNHVDHTGKQEVSYRPTEHTPMLEQRRSVSTLSTKSAIGFIGALKIPGVVEYSLCLFFSKLVSYTFLYWLPLYIQSSTTLGATLSADLSTLFDVGGIVGAITAGLLSDYTGMSACTCSGMLIFAVPMLLVYQTYGALSLPLNIFLLFVVGVLVNGPYSLITTSVSAELGTHSSLEGNSKALATVTAIIDGTGSIGAAVGPLLAGLVSSSGWENVFYMLMISDILALVLLIRLVGKELARLKRNPRID